MISKQLCSSSSKRLFRVIGLVTTAYFSRLIGGKVRLAKGLDKILVSLKLTNVVFDYILYLNVYFDIFNVLVNIFIC